MDAKQRAMILISVIMLYACRPTSGRELLYTKQGPSLVNVGVKPSAMYSCSETCSSFSPKENFRAINGGSTDPNFPSTLCQVAKGSGMAMTFGEFSLNS